MEKTNQEKAVIAVIAVIKEMDTTALRFSGARGFLPIE